MRADNQGEGGILALTALLPAKPGRPSRGRPVDRPILIGLGIFGAALLYGDGMITPAITVLGAVEGLQVATPLFSPYVLPLSVAIMVGIFVIQQFGTHRVGRPLRTRDDGLVRHDRRARRSHGSCSEPAVLGAFDPRHAVRSSSTTAGTDSWCWARSCSRSRAARRCTPTWGTSGSGRSGWPGSALVLPALLLNYFGQGALSCCDPAPRSSRSSSWRRAGCSTRSWSLRRWPRSSRRRRSSPAPSR